MAVAVTSIVTAMPMTYAHYIFQGLQDTAGLFTAQSLLTAFLSFFSVEVAIAAAVVTDPVTSSFSSLSLLSVVSCCFYSNAAPFNKEP